MYTEGNTLFKVVNIVTLSVISLLHCNDIDKFTDIFFVIIEFAIIKLLFQTNFK